MKKKKQPIRIEITNHQIKGFLNPFMKAFLEEIQGIYYVSMDLTRAMERLKRTNKILILISSISLISTILLFLILLLKL